MKPLKWLLTNNVGWKLGSLALAAVLWMLVVGEPQLITVEAVSVYYRNLPDGITVTSDQPDAVELEIQGASAVLSRESLDGVKILLDLSRVTGPGQQTFTISPADVTLPEGVNFRSAVPSRVFLDFDRLSTKEIPIEVEISGIPADGYRVAKTEADPPSVRVSGPEQRLAELTTAQTDAVDVSDLRETVKTSVGVYVFDPSLQLENGAPVAATVIIEKEPASEH